MRLSNVILLTALSTAASSIAPTESNFIKHPTSYLQNKGRSDTYSVNGVSNFPSDGFKTPLKVNGGAAASSAVSAGTLGLASVLGGFLTHLTLGTIYCWGNFHSYMPQSMRYWSGSGVGTPDSLMIIPLGLFAMCIGMPMSSTLQAKLGLPGA